MSALTFVTYNVNGIGSPNSTLKRRKIFNFLHSIKASVIMLQETHSSPKDENFWKAEWGGNIIFNHGSSNARGVLILFNHNFDGKILNCYRDEFGRVLIISIVFEEIEYTIANLYAPNEDNINFYVQAFNEMETLGLVNVCLGGDFNTVLI